MSTPVFSVQVAVLYNLGQVPGFYILAAFQQGLPHAIDSANSKGFRPIFPNETGLYKYVKLLLF